MKLIIRNSNQNDLEKIYELHKTCFSENDHWYKSAIKHYLNDSIIIETLENDIIGVLLQGCFTPNCDNDICSPITINGNIFINNNNHNIEQYGIVMICIDNKYRNIGLAQKLISKHFDLNNNKILCLNVRKSNINAFNLYKKMGYEHIINIKNKYFLPTEDSLFMIKNIF